MRKKYFFIVISIIIIGSGIVYLQILLTEAKKKVSQEVPQIPYIVEADKIKPYLLGFSMTYAHIVWIKTMLYFGSHYLTDQNYPHLASLLDFITRINPYFFPAYEFAALILPQYTKNYNEARIIVQRGIFHVGASSYKLSFYMGWISYSLYNDYQSAADYFMLSSHKKDAPLFIAPLAARLLTHAGDINAARSFLMLSYETAENPLIKSVLAKKLTELP